MFWVATDFHFGHKKMLEVGRQPGYEQKILKQLSQIPDDDTLIFLGDFCIGNDEKWHHEINQFWFRKWLIRGNHDDKSTSWYLSHGWNAICNEMTMEIYGEWLSFSHNPMGVSDCDVNIHGHLHKEGSVLKVSGRHILATEYPQTLKSILKK